MSIHLYLSPHLDDAVLSCGGQIAQLVRAGSCVHVATVFAGDVPFDAANTLFVQELHARWGLGQNPPAARRAEDIVALETLGAGAQVTHLPFADCVYRLGAQGEPLYPTRDAVFGAVAQVEGPLIEEIACSLERSCASVARDANVHLYVPLTAGHHVDHQIVRAVGERWAGSHWQVMYYEDYPYAERSDEIAAALGEGAFRVRLVELDEPALSAKITAIACYQSQLSTFFADKAEMAARVRAYAQAVGAGYPAERLWLKS